MKVPTRLLLWKWSADFDSPAKRKKAKLKFSDITAGFVCEGRHAAIGPADIAGFQLALDEAFGRPRGFSLFNKRPFAIETHDNCAVVCYSEAVRIELVPKIAEIGRRFGLNASEF